MVLLGCFCIINLFYFIMHFILCIIIVYHFGTWQIWLYWKEWLGHPSKIHLLCSAEERKPFRMTWGWLMQKIIVFLRMFSCFPVYKYDSMKKYEKIFCQVNYPFKWNFHIPLWISMFYYSGIVFWLTPRHGKGDRPWNNIQQALFHVGKNRLGITGKRILVESAMAD